jgi:elongation factor P
MISPGQFKSGMVIKLGGKLYTIVSYQHVKPGKGPAYYRTKLKGLDNESVIENTFRSDEKIETVFIDEKKLTYLYNDGHIYHFMDQETYEQVPIEANMCQDIADFLMESAEVNASLANNKIMSVNLPNFVDLKVIKAEPGAKGDTAKSTALKKVTLESGAQIMVPMFINEGDKIRIDTRTKEYSQKAK